jgi:hypothetical protein
MRLFATQKAKSTYEVRLVPFFRPPYALPMLFTESCDSLNLGRKESFPCVRVLYFGSARQTEDVDVTVIWREWTRN